MDWKKRFGMPNFKPASSSSSKSGATTSGNMFAPPANYSSSGPSTRGISGMDAVTTSMQYGMNSRKRQLDEDEILEEGDDPSGLDYIPAPDSPSAPKQSQDDDNDEDPLDAYMAGIEVKARKDKETSEKQSGESSTAAGNSSTAKLKTKGKLGRTDIEDEDDLQESYFQWMEENRSKGDGADKEEEEEIEYDEEGNPLPPKKKHIDPLPPVDHDSIKYEPFERNFYIEHSNISELKPDQVADLRKKLDVRVTGANAPNPVTSFAHFGFDERLMNVIRKSEYTKPTPIQAQGIPIALSGRDIIGIAKTGSGKTAAYLWPALVHIMDQRELAPDEGPICLIVVPTRELAMQVYTEAKKFGKVYNIKVVCAYGGGSKWEQSKALQEGAEIVVCTPGRLIDMVKIKATNLTRVTYLVFDEADRMFDLGFEPQVRSIANHVRPDRQCLMFSATFKRKIERLARDILTDPIRVVQGELGEANEDIQQLVEVMSGPARYPWLLGRLVSFCSMGKVLIFVNKKQNAEELAQSLKGKDFRLGLLHGDMMQYERNEVIHAFRKEDMPILIATDVAARGLDIPAIKVVINYDVARDIDTHVHRIGRTGRAGEKGLAYTLFTDKDSKDSAGHLVRNLESVNQPVPEKLLEIANQSSWFRKSRFRQGKGKKPQIGGRGLGFTESASGASFSGSSSRLGGFSATPSGVMEAMAQSPNSTTGTDRLTAMKAAFSAHYKTVFRPASADTTLETQSREPQYTEPNSEWKQQLDAIRRTAERGGRVEDRSKKERESGEKKKKSRWD